MSDTPPVQIRDTSPLQSKKFMAYLVAELSSKALLGCGLFILKDHIGEGSTWHWWWMITLTICVTFLEVGAILGIAYVDKFVRTAQILSGGPTGGAGRAPTPTPAAPASKAPFEVPTDLQEEVTQP